MRNKTLLIATASLLLFVLVSCAASEISWSITNSKTDSLRQLVGLPSIAEGNLNPASRNPALEIMCTSLYDSPGGYCYYFTNGIPITNITVISNVTVEVTK
jgi:hypothetical protein